MEEYEIIVLIKHGLYSPWMDIATKGQCETWLKGEIPNNLKIVHFYGKPVGGTFLKIDLLHENLRWKNIVTGRLIRFIDKILQIPIQSWIPAATFSDKLKTSSDEILCEVYDTYFSLKWKQLAAYKFITSNYKFNYLYETNSSSYVDLVNLSKLINKLPKSNLYAGTLPWPDSEFVSGASRLTSKDVVDKILENRKKWDASLLEDVAFGKLMRRLNISASSLSSISLNNVEAVERIHMKLLDSNFHFRVKSGTQSKRNDIQIMKSLHKRFQEFRGKQET